MLGGLTKLSVSIQLHNVLLVEYYIEWILMQHLLVIVL